MDNLIVLDTSAIINFSKASDKGKAIKTYFDSLQNVRYCIATPVVAELLVFSEANQWGVPRQQAIKNFVDSCMIIDINAADQELLDAYKDIDLFSRRKKAINGSFLSAGSIKMGKNDLWIAATAMVLNAPLITTDKDFSHLNNAMVTIIEF